MRTFLLVPLLLLALPAFAQTNTAAPAPGGSDGSASTQGPAPHQKFENADSDHDGRLSRSEAQAMPFVAKHFDAVDTNHDGYISRDELRAAREQMRAMRAQRSGGQSGSSTQQQPSPPPPGSSN